MQPCVRDTPNDDPKRLDQRGPEVTLLRSSLAAGPRTLVNIFEETVEACPDEPALDNGAVVLTYAVGRSARRERDAATLVLAGVTVAAFFTAWQTFVQQRNSETLQQAAAELLAGL